MIKNIQLLEIPANELEKVLEVSREHRKLYNLNYSIHIDDIQIFILGIQQAPSTIPLENLTMWNAANELFKPYLVNKKHLIIIDPYFEGDE